MSKAYKWAVWFLLAAWPVCAGATYYAVKVWPDKVEADARRNANAAAQIEVWERQLRQREALLRLENERLQAQARLADATTKAAEATAKLAGAMGVLTEDINNNWRLYELKKATDEFNERQKKK